MIKTFLVAALMMSVFAVQENSLKQGDLSQLDLPDVVMNSGLGRAIMSLAQLQAKSQQVELGKLFDAIDELENAIKDSRTEEQQSFANDYNQYTSDINFYQNQVTTYKNEVAQHENDIAELKDKDDSLVKKLEAKRQELKQFQQLHQSVGISLSDSGTTFETRVNDQQKAIDSLDQAIELIAQIKKGSFIEVSSVESTKSKLQDSLKGQRFLYQPLIQALVQLSQEKFVNQRQIAQVLALLNDLRKQLVAAKLSQTSTFQSERERNEALQSEYQQLVSSLQDAVIPQVQTQIENNQGEISTKNGLLNSATDNLADATKAFDAVEAAWVKRQNDNSTLKKKYDEELVVIAQARTALERGGVKRD